MTYQATSTLGPPALPVAASAITTAITVMVMVKGVMGAMRSMRGATVHMTGPLAVTEGKVQCTTVHQVISSNVIES